MSATTTATPLSVAMALAIVDEARDKDYSASVVGVRGVPDRSLSQEVQHRGEVVLIRPAESALAVREVLAEKPADGWLVVVTDREDDDLGAGILAHFAWQRLRSPDPWEAVRHRFSATGIDPALTQVPDSRDLATGLLAAAPPGGWPSAPAGILTRNHALSAVASAHLDLERDGVDALTVLRWTMRAGSATSVATLRSSSGDRVADETLRWVAQQAGSAAEAIAALLRHGEIADVVPVAIALSLLTGDAVAKAEVQHEAQLALVRLEPRWGATRPSERSMQALGQTARALLADLVHDRRWSDSVERALRRADEIVAQCQADGLAGFSDLLPRGLRARLTTLAGALRRVPAADATSPAWAEVEGAWTRVLAHALSSTSSRELAPFQAAVRLTRWLGAASEPESSDLLTLSRRHMATGAWVDAAVNDVLTGTDDDTLAAGLGAVAQAARARRRDEERAFARALTAAAPSMDGSRRLGAAQEAGAQVWTVESLVPDVVIPLAKTAPVLLLVMDGMSAATATDVVEDAIVSHGWYEAALPGGDGTARAAALAVLPSLTEVSRCSMLTGRLARGQQGAELKGYAELTSAGGKISAALFHKKEVDTRVAGWAIGDEVGRAISDTEMKLVSVVLNTIDDALDRSDPAGTTWTADAIKHLGPLLARARAAGRTVVMTADHGHVVERRAGTQRSYPDVSSGRSRAVTGSVEDGELEVTGPRVLTEDHRAVLAVDEDLRYGPLKAGYHGGASAAEVVVPVVVLVADPESNPHGLSLLPPQAPVWWFTSASAGAAGTSANEPDAPATTARASVPGLATASASGPTLFDELDEAEPKSAEPASGSSLGHAVVSSKVYAGQRTVNGRLIVTDDQVARLIDVLVAGSGRVPDVVAATALRLNAVRLRGALAQVQQLLNIDGYSVLGADLSARAVTLDVALLREQFEIR